MPSLSSTTVMEGAPAVTRIVHAGEGSFHNTVLSKDEGSSQSTYEIVMVSLTGGLLLLLAIGAAISILRRHCTSNYFSRDVSTPVVVENIPATNNCSDKISTVDLTGPVCLSYISDKQMVSPESAISKETISISKSPFSFAALITTPASAPEQ